MAYGKWTREMFERALRLREQGMLARDIAAAIQEEFGVAVKKRSMQTMFSRYKAVEGTEAALQNWDASRASAKEISAIRSRGGKGHWRTVDAMPPKQREVFLSERAQKGWAGLSQAKRRRRAKAHYIAMSTEGRTKLQQAGTAASRSKARAKPRTGPVNKRIREALMYAAADSAPPIASVARHAVVDVETLLEHVQRNPVLRFWHINYLLTRGELKPETMSMEQWQAFKDGRKRLIQQRSARLKRIQAKKGTRRPGKRKHRAR